MPPIRTGKMGEPGYDEILSRTHVPFVLKKKLEDVGFRDVKTLFYHFHALPPMLWHSARDFVLQASINQENPDDWRGYFMASAFILTGRKDG